MSKVVQSEQFVFHTDLGVVKTTMTVEEDYDIEDIVADRAASQAIDLKFQYSAERVNINDPTSPRTLKSLYLKEPV